MNHSSIETEMSVEKLSVILLSSTKKELRNLKLTNPETFCRVREALFSALIEAKRIHDHAKLAIDRMNSL